MSSVCSVMGLKVEVLGFCCIGRKPGTMFSPGGARKCLQWLPSNQNTQVTESQTPVTHWGLIPIVSLVPLFHSAPLLLCIMVSTPPLLHPTSLPQIAPPQVTYSKRLSLVTYWTSNVQRRMWNLWTFSHTQRIPRILRCISFNTFLWIQSCEYNSLSSLEHIRPPCVVGQVVHWAKVAEHTSEASESCIFVGGT